MHLSHFKPFNFKHREYEKEITRGEDIRTTKKRYIAPDCTVIPIDGGVGFVCTSVRPGKDGSTEDGWDEDEDEDIDGEAELDIGG